MNYYEVMKKKKRTNCICSSFRRRKSITVDGGEGHRKKQKNRALYIHIIAWVKYLGKSIVKMKEWFALQQHLMLNNFFLQLIQWIYPDGNMHFYV